MHSNLSKPLHIAFPYLHQYGFSLLSGQEDHRLSSMEFGSTEFKLRFDFLEGLIDIFVATYFPEWSKYGPWYGLAIYIEYLEGNPV